jgi:galactose-1-phosphate uridylyltransferase
LKESTKDEQTVLVAMAKGEEAGLTLEELHLQLPELETLEKAVERLRHRDVVEVDNTTGKVYFLVKLNRNWVRNIQPKT